jgi:hypothetical protein
LARLLFSGHAVAVENAALRMSSDGQRQRRDRRNRECR